MFAAHLLKQRSGYCLGQYAEAHSGPSFVRQPRFIIANQPTRGLDLGAVTYVHQQLLNARANGAGILLISEDLEELLSLSDRIHVLYKGHLSEAIATENASIQEIGLMMAGKGFGSRG